MNREQMVERLADAIAAENWDEVCTCEDCASNSARRLLDAILPVVTTVAELEALPSGSVVLDTDFGVAYELTGLGWCSPGDPQIEKLDADDFPLTVVWQPETERKA